ncbi:MULTISPECIES: 50S ribosomal protein L31 [Anaeromyxobacter]|uniref:50S ribosomal protein L31 n=1 Tax=Anaeromyxobacter TaxID=161492 RepID=UPI001F59CDF7|nr:MULTISPECIES: 50S ribosomal protein L31 [unclassified Anaeromyxobacter]
MKEALHPDYKPAKVTCACGNVIETRSTRGDFHIEICAQCHPFFTGKQKIMDTAGRIEKFKTRYAATPAKAEAAKKAEPVKAEPAKKAEAPKENRAAKRAKAGKSAKPKAEAAPAEPAAEAKGE